MSTPSSIKLISTAYNTILLQTSVGFQPHKSNITTTGAAICTATQSNRMQTKLVLAVICLMLGAALASPIDRSSTGEQEQARSSNEVMQEKFNTDKTQEKAEAPQIMVREKQRNKRSTGRGD